LSIEAKSPRCPSCHRPLKRSNEANRLYWALVNTLANKAKPQGEQFSPETWHVWLKTKFLGADDVRMPNGKVIVVPKSTAELDKHEFSEYFAQVEAWCAEHDVYLEEMPA